MELKQFNKGLTTLSTNGQKLQDDIHSLAMYALHCLNIGKTAGLDSPMQRLWNTVNTLKGINRQAFMSWAQEYGSCKFHKQEDQTFLIKYLDKTKYNPDFDAVNAVEIAQGIPFWEFSKEPTPNVKPYDVMEAMRNIIAQAKAAATGGKDGAKPKRKIEHAELLDVLSSVLAAPDNVRQKLGLTTPSEDKAIVPLADMTSDEEAQAEMVAERGALKAA